MLLLLAGALGLTPVRMKGLLGFTTILCAVYNMSRHAYKSLDPKWCPEWIRRALGGTGELNEGASQAWDREKGARTAETSE